MSANLSSGIQKMITLSKEDQTFKDGLMGCKTQEAVLTFLKSNDIAVTADELGTYTNQSSKLSDDDLDQVAGGCFIHGHIF